MITSSRCQHSPNLSITSLLIVALTWFCSVGAQNYSCQLYAAPTQNTLNNVCSTYLNVTTCPDGIAYGLHGDVAFVANASSQTSLSILNTTTFTPTLINAIELGNNFGHGPEGVTLTPNGRHVLVAFNNATIVVDAAKAVERDPDPVVGVLLATPGMNSAFAVTVTSDGEWVFVAQEAGFEMGPAHNFGAIEVYHLHKPTANGTVTGTLIGYITLGLAIADLALSPDERYLYAPSEIISPAYANNTNPLEPTGEGALYILDVETLKTKPSDAFIANTTAMCGPVRVLVSTDGKIVWVAARESNHFLTFDAEKLRSKQPSLISATQVGTSSSSLVFVHHESRIITSDSNRQCFPGAVSGLSVVNVSAALLNKSDAVPWSDRDRLVPALYDIEP